MKVGELCSRQVVSVSESASLRDTASLMGKHHVGTVVVVDKVSGKDRPLGIITDRDIVRAQLEHVADLSRLRVADVMTKPAVTLAEDETIQEAVETLRAHRVRRVPVINAQGELIGLVSSDDLIAEVTRVVSSLAQMLRLQTAQEGHRSAAER
jgi:CBS domain-containing protein